MLLHKELENKNNSLTTEMPWDVFYPRGFHSLNLEVESSLILTLLPSTSACWLTAVLAHSQMTAMFSLAQTAESIPSHPLHVLQWDAIRNHSSESQHRGDLSVIDYRIHFCPDVGIYLREPLLIFFFFTLLGRTWDWHKGVILRL